MIASCTGSGQRATKTLFYYKGINPATAATNTKNTKHSNKIGRCSNSWEIRPLTPTKGGIKEALVSPLSRLLTSQVRRTIIVSPLISATTKMQEYNACTHHVQGCGKEKQDKNLHPAN
jgi:hypothetical protein